MPPPGENISMEFMLVYILGGLLYALAEIIWRGWTHWSMVLCGGLCFTLMYLISMSPLSLHRKWILSAVTITTVEFLTGCLVNLVLKWHIWDYSALPFNLLGQICPQFLLIWLALSVPGIALCEALRRFMAGILYQ